MHALHELQRQLVATPAFVLRFLKQIHRAHLAPSVTRAGARGVSTLSVPTFGGKPVLKIMAAKHIARIIAFNSDLNGGGTPALRLGKPNGPSVTEKGEHRRKEKYGAPLVHTL